MAERIEDYQVRPPEIGQSATEELHQLIETLHRRGILRFANDVIDADAGVAKVLVDGLNQPGPLNAIQNVATLAMALSTIEPGQFYKLVFAVRDAALAVADHAPEGRHGDEAPGVTGAYKLLHDDALWHALGPLIAGLKRFAEGMDREVEKPISAFTGKESNA